MPAYKMKYVWLILLIRNYSINIFVEAEELEMFKYVNQ